MILNERLWHSSGVWEVGNSLPLPGASGYLLTAQTKGWVLDTPYNCFSLHLVSSCALVIGEQERGHYDGMKKEAGA